MRVRRWSEDGPDYTERLLFEEQDWHWIDKRYHHARRTYPPPRESAAWMSARWQRDVCGIACVAEDDKDRIGGSDCKSDPNHHRLQGGSDG